MSITNIKEAITKSSNYPLLGYAVYWSISDVRVKHLDFVELLKQVGLDPDVAPAVRTKSALIKAIRSNTKGRRSTFHKNVVDNKDRAGFAIVNTTAIDADTVDVDFETETRIILDKLTKQVRIDGPNKDSIEASFNEHKDIYTSDKFRNAVLKVVKTFAQGVAIRERGGVYFIPTTHFGELNKLQKLFDYFPQCSLDIIPIVDTVEAKKSMWKSLIGEVSEELAIFKADLHDMDGTEKDSSLEVRIERYQKLKDKVENYETLLSYTASDLKTELEALTVALKAKLEL